MIMTRGMYVSEPYCPRVFWGDAGRLDKVIFTPNLLMANVGRVILQCKVTHQIAKVSLMKNFSEDQYKEPRHTKPSHVCAKISTPVTS